MCVKKRRFLQKNSINTRNAHKLFTHWQRTAGIMKRGKTKTLDEFCRSPYYNLFMKLEEFVREVNVVSGYRYIDWLVEKRIPEKTWFDEKGLNNYHEYMRRTEDPCIQVENTCNHIKEWCHNKNISTKMFFISITPGQALNMVRSNQLSPWVLFGYKPSLEGLVSRIDSDVLHNLNDHINLNYWLDKIEGDQDSVDLVSAKCKDLLNDVVH